MDPKIWWYLSRATGLVAWGLAVGSILCGMALATRALGSRPPAPWLLALHRWLAGLTIAFTAGHVAAIVADSYVHFGPADVLVPFATSWRPAPVAAGILAAWLLVAIELTSLQMRRLPKELWRAIHLSSYVVAVLATAHGFTAGADASNPAFIASAVVVGAVTVFFATYRILAPKKAERRIPPRPSASRTPLEGEEAAQPRRVQERVRLRDSAPGPDGGEVTDGGPLVPDAPPVGDEVVDPVPTEPVGLG